MSLYLFDGADQLLRVVPNDKLMRLKQTQEINGLDTLEATCLDSMFVGSARFMAVRDAYDRNSMHMYKIVNKQEGNDQRMNLEGVQIAYDELLAYGYIKDIRPQNQSARMVLNQLLAGSKWTVRYVSADLGTASSSYYYVSRLEAIRDFVEKWDAEIQFRVAVSSRQITDRFVDVYHRMGKNTGKRFAYGTNLLTIVKDEDYSELYTALVGRGKGEQVSNAEDNAGGQAGYGRKITFSDVVWKKSNGHPVDKPAGQEWVEDPAATAQWGFPDGTPRTGFVEFSEIEDKAELLRRTWQKLKEVSRPKVSLKTTVLNVGDMGLGDTVRIIHHEKKYYYEVRVRKLVRDLLNNRKTSIELGDAVVQSEASYRRSIDSSLRKQLQVTYDVVQLAADGQTKIFRQTTMPTSGMRKNDLWYKPINNSRERELYVYNGNAWVLDKVSAGLLSGTLDAQNGDVNLINVNVANIVGETSEFVKSAWNGINSVVNIDGSGITARHDDGSYTLMNGQGLFHREGGSNYHTNYLTHIESISHLNHSFFEDGENGLFWVQLPAVFRGKQFHAFIVPSDTLNYEESDFDQHAIQRIITYVRTDRIDYANARVPVVGFVRVKNLETGQSRRCDLQATLIVTY